MNFRTLFCCLLLLGTAVRVCAQQDDPAPVVAQPAIGPEVGTAALDIRLAALLKLPAADPDNAALLSFKLEQAQIWQAEVRQYWDETPLSYIDSYRGVLNRATVVQAATTDAAVTPGSNFQERAYFAADDGSAQPYWVAVPDNYDPARKWPLVLLLHGYSPYISEINLPMPSEETVELAGKLGFLLAVPYGRRNSDFLQYGEDDVFAVRQEVESQFNIDDSRVFLTGSSMGGSGAWTVGLHAPARWAAVAPICGRTDLYAWFHLDRDGVPPWKRILYDADNARSLELNALHLPLYVQHGALDETVLVENSRDIVRDARKLKLPLFYREDEMGGHDSIFQQASQNSALNWFANLKPILIPNQFDIVTGDLREAQSYWGQITAFSTYGEMAHLTVKLGTGGAIDVKATNVAAFELNPPASLAPAGTALTLTINGQVWPGSCVAGTPIVWHAPDALLGKSPTACGPVKNAFRDPFLLVYGSANDRLAAEAFRKEWYLFVDGWPPLRDAASITDADKARYNLILFGTRASNPLLGEIADQLPVELTPTGYRFGTKLVTAPGVGLRMVWKSPWNPQRLVVVESGLWWGAEQPVNHKLDLIPDYIVYTDKLEAADQTNHALAAGYFNGDWQLGGVSVAQPKEQPQPQTQPQVKVAAGP